MRYYQNHAMVRCSNCAFRMPIAKITAKAVYIRMMFCVSCDTDHSFEKANWTTEDRKNYDRVRKGY